MATFRSAPPIRLPSDLARSLKYLDDAELQRLKDAVATEIGSRGQVLVKKQSNRAHGSTAATAQIPEGKANLIRASFKAGLTPPAIARTSGVPLALVRRVLMPKNR